MFSNFSFSFNAVMPLVLLMALGYLLRSLRFLPREFFSGGNKLIFHVFLPCALFCNIYSIKDLSHVNWSVIIFVYAATILFFLFSRVVTRAFVPEIPSRGVVMQTIFRSNSALIGLPLASALGGGPAAAVMSLIIGFSVPLFNTLAVVALTTGEGLEASRKKDTLLGILKNPLTLGSLAGIAALGIRMLIPVSNGALAFSLSRDLPFLYSAVEKLGSLATPFSMVVLGALLDFSAVGKKIRYIVLGSIWRLILAPVVSIGAAVILSSLGVISCGAAEYASLLSLFAAPAAVSSAVMAAEMHADAELARQYVVWTSVGMIVTLPVWIMLMRSLGLI